MGGLPTPQLGRKVDDSPTMSGTEIEAETDWRRRRDSNPRDPFGSNGFQDRRFQPLTHSSGYDSTARSRRYETRVPSLVATCAPRSIDCGDGVAVCHASLMRAEDGTRNCRFLPCGRNSTDRLVRAP